MPKRTPKTIHFNMELGSNQLIMKYFEDARDGRSFSSFVKESLHELAIAYYTNDESKTNQFATKKALTKAMSNGDAVINEEIKQEPAKGSTPVDVTEEVKTDIESAAASMFGVS